MQFATVPLSNTDLVAVVDQADHELVMRYVWCPRPAKSTTYCDCVPLKTSLHRFLLQPEKGMVVDHIDGDGLNNRRSNLRVCTNQQNVQHRVNCNSNARVPFVGVAVVRSSSTYAAYITIDCKKISLGIFDSAIEAALARDAAAKFYFGEFASVNVPEIETVPLDVNALRPHGRTNRKAVHSAVYRGTHLNRAGRWGSKVELTENGRTVRRSLGAYSTEHEAALAYDSACRYYLPGKVKALNFPGVAHPPKNAELLQREARVKSKSAKASVYFGVCRQRNGKYNAKICIGSRTIGLGSFHTPESAARAYDDAVIHYRPGSRMLNFPDEHTAWDMDAVGQ